MTLAARLKSLRESTDKSQKEFAALVGASFRAWQDYEAGNSVPGGKIFESLANLGFDTNWLLTGSKPRHEEKSLSSGTKPDREFTDGSDGTFVLVPRYEVAASAGSGAVIHSEQIVDYLSFKSEWVKDVMGLSVKELALINVKGDSMEPTLSSGDLILVDLRTPQIQENAVYVLQLNGGLLVKRIQRKLDGTVIVKGDNPVYEPEVLQSEAVDRLTVIGRVVWCGRRM